nr:uncharacterized protein LOC128672092 isoform X2 [Plodia interpunctella]
MLWNSILLLLALSQGYSARLTYFTRPGKTDQFSDDYYYERNLYDSSESDYDAADVRVTVPIIVLLEKTKASRVPKEESKSFESIYERKFGKKPGMLSKKRSKHRLKSLFRTLRNLVYVLNFD